MRWVRAFWLYWFNLFVATDQWVNAVTGGHPDETISSRVGRGFRARRVAAIILRPVINLLFRPFQSDHCEWAVERAKLKGENVPLCARCNETAQEPGRA